MLGSSNVRIRRFMRKIEAICGGFALVEYNFHRLSPDTVLQGRALVKTALYHIRRGLKTGNIHGVSLDDRQIVKYFASAEHLDELWRLGGFETFWSHEDRGLRITVMAKLAELATEKDLPRLNEFRGKLEKIKYRDHEEFDFDTGRDITFGGREWNEFDRMDFARIAERVNAQMRT